jgi:hypothetical protein
VGEPIFGAMRRNTSRVEPGRLPTGVATLAYTYGEGFFAIALVVWIAVSLFVAVGVIRRRDLGLQNRCPSRVAVNGRSQFAHTAGCRPTIRARSSRRRSSSSAR